MHPLRFGRTARSRRWIGATALAAVVAIAPTFAQSTSQAPHDHEQATPAQKTGMMGQDHQRMMADMKAADDRLQDLMSKMNAATGDQKVNAMADLLTQLVADQRKMHQHMMEMHDQMMSHK
jgi:hypothetical protein